MSRQSMLGLSCSRLRLFNATASAPRLMDKFHPIKDIILFDQLASLFTLEQFPEIGKCKFGSVLGIPHLYL